MDVIMLPSYIILLLAITVRPFKFSISRSTSIFLPEFVESVFHFTIRLIYIIAKKKCKRLISGAIDDCR